jgi:hypothetical protein
MENLNLEEEEKASAHAIAAYSTTISRENGNDDRQTTAQASASDPPPGEEVDGEDSERHDFFFDGAADGKKCSIGFCLMTEAVVAMDGFSYQKSSLEEYIAHCAATGQPLTYPLTKERMSEMYTPNHHVRTYVKDYIEEREKEWRLHVAQRRTERKGR